MCLSFAHCWELPQYLEIRCDSHVRDSGAGSNPMDLVVFQHIVDELHLVFLFASEITKCDQQLFHQMGHDPVPNQHWGVELVGRTDASMILDDSFTIPTILFEFIWIQITEVMNTFQVVWTMISR